MFGKRSSQAAVQRATDTLANNLSAQLTVYLNMGILVEAIESEPYIAGYINGKIVSFIAYSIKHEGLNQSDANQVSGRVLLDVFGEDTARTISSSINQHASNASQEYQQGQQRGALVIAYAVGAQDIQSEPEYRNALEALKGIQETSHREEMPDDMAAIAGLEELWFNSLMKDFLRQ